MTGRVVILQTIIEGKTLNEDPMLVTEKGVLNYQGILSLSPSFTKKTTNANFMDIEEYKMKTGTFWLEVETSRWNDEIRFKQNLIVKEKNPFKKEWLKTELKAWMLKKPKNWTVSEKKEICQINFVKAVNEEAWRERYEVEMIGMRAATQFYEEKGYQVYDVSSQNRGYDIECRRVDSILRVEVKGIKGMPFPLMTENEHRMAEFYRASYILFIAKIHGDKCDRFEIPDPITNLNIITITKPVYQMKGYKDFNVKSGSLISILRYITKNQGQISEAPIQIPQAETIDLSKKPIKTDQIIEMFKELIVFEREIRDFISEQLKAHSENLWRSPHIPVVIRNNWLKRKNSDEKEGKPPELNPLNYADFSDYKEIIFYNWKNFFYKYFKDKEKLRVRLDDLNALCRRSTMHNRSITKDEIGSGKVIIRWLRSRMRTKKDEY